MSIGGSAFKMLNMVNSIKFYYAKIHIRKSKIYFRYLLNILEHFPSGYEGNTVLPTDIALRVSKKPLKSICIV